MKNFTVKRNPMNASSVEKPSIILLTSEDMTEFTLEKNHMYLSIVGKPSVNPVPFTIMKEFTLQSNTKYRMWEGLLITDLSETYETAQWKELISV